MKSFGEDTTSSRFSPPRIILFLAILISLCFCGVLLSMFGVSNTLTVFEQNTDLHSENNHEIFDEFNNVSEYGSFASECLLDNGGDPTNQIIIGTGPSDINYFNYHNNILTNHHGTTYERTNDGIMIINDERYLTFGFQGDCGDGIGTFTSSNFTWTWEVEQVGPDYIFNATNNNNTFLWNQSWYFYYNQSLPMKIEHYIENNDASSITDMQLYYAITINENDTLEYDDTTYYASDFIDSPFYATGKFNSKLAKVDFNEMLGFGFSDLINSSYDINEFYVGNSSFLGFQNENIMCVGFTTDTGILLSGHNLTTDPSITAKPDTYAVYGLWDVEFHTENGFTTGFAVSDINTYEVMTSTQYDALSTDDSSHVITGGDNSDDGGLYVNFSVPYVDSINWFEIEVIAIGDGTEGWYMGAYNDTTDEWDTMNSTTTAGDVSLTYNVTGAEVATYSELVNNNANFSVAIWSSTSTDSSFEGDLFSITFNYEQVPDTTDPTYSNAGTNTTVINKLCAFTITYDDNMFLHDNGQYKFSTNNTGSWVNESAINFTATPQTIVTNKTLSSTEGAIIGYRWYANDSTGNDNNTPIYTVVTTKNLWISNSTIVNGLTDVGLSATPTTFYNLFGDNNWHMISGRYIGNFYGYRWNGTGWEGNASVYNGLPDVGDWSAPTVFYNMFEDDKWHLIIGEQAGTFNGYQWNGSGWNSNSTVIGGLVDVGIRSTPTVVYNVSGDSKWHLISGEYDDGYNGYQWNGASWDSNSTIIAGLPTTGTQHTPAVFYNIYGDSKWHLIQEDLNYNGYRWNGTGWESNSSVVTGLEDATSLNPSVIYDLFGDEKWNIIGGNSDGTFEGFVSQLEDEAPSYNVTYANVSETTTFTDSVKITKTAAPLEIDEPDTITVMDTISITKTAASVLYNLYLQDTITFSDGVSITKTVAPIIYNIYEDDIITITDNITVTKILASVMYYANVSETVTFTDTIIISKTIAGVNYSKKEDDTISIDDNVVLNKTVATASYNVSASDTIGFSDSISSSKTTAGVNYSINTSDTVTIIDSIGITKTLAFVMYYVNVSDTITITDTFIVSKTIAVVNYSINNGDTITITDSIAFTKTTAIVNYSVNISDTITVSDGVEFTKTTGGVNYSSNVTDTITITDGIIVTKTTSGVNYYVNMSDSIGVADSIRITKTAVGVNYSIGVSDSVTITDGVYITKAAAADVYSINTTDTITITDNIKTTKAVAGVNYSIHLSDTITITDGEVEDRTLVPVDIFIGMGVFLFVLAGASFYFTGIFAIFTSMLSVMVAFIMSKVAVNGTLIENIGGIDSSGNIIQGFTIIEMPALSYILCFVGLFMVVILAAQVFREIKFRESRNTIELDI